jgi:hypothetical protein
MDALAVHLLLDCLEDAMKRNGDIRLAAVPPEAMATLELTGVGRLFEIFETCAEAIGSYRSLPAHVCWQNFAPAGDLGLAMQYAAA